MNGVIPPIKMQISIDRCGGKPLIRLLAVLLALAVAAPMLLAQEWDHWDHMNGRDKAHDPTGAWLLNTGAGFALTVFHKGGTLTGDVQGESAFDPSAVNPPKPPSNVINSPESGVWQKTGWNTFAVTFLTMEYQVDTSTNPPSAPLFQFDKVQFTGVLNESGDGMEITAALITTFNPDGSLKESITVPSKTHGVRIPLEILPHTANTLPIPSVPN
jgi:hypothetical protein